ncbi:MAG: hypothetical protein JW895_00850 [Thermoleophilaceae bacterium]|nr:hypothetical protein [Thermoleophilaceae bacterium]
MRVEANTAAVGFRIVESTDPSLVGWTGEWDLTDGGAGQPDRYTLDHLNTSGAEPDCTDFRAGSEVRSGDIVIVDATPFPVSKGDCKNGGWRNYPAFQTQGDCVSYVIHQARQECLFIRAAHGPAAFRAWYGTPVTHRHAMVRCVRQRSND